VNIGDLDDPHARESRRQIGKLRLQTFHAQQTRADVSEQHAEQTQ
jgi:hypothetical protein